MRARVDEAALRTVITYKWVKGVVQLLLFAALLTTVALGLDDDLGRWAHEFRNHSTRAYAVLLGRALERATTPRGLHITLLALLVDGCVTCLEGWALQRRHPWGPWLVVGVSGSLLPFEVYELFRRFRWIRLLVLVVNAAVVAFLVMHARAQAQGFEAETSPPESPRRVKEQDGESVAGEHAPPRA
jgi:uncharacterized membrane protein (DUF2068 family)